MEFKPFFMLQILLIIFMSRSVLGLKKCNFPAIFNFGDSNSDTGGYSAAFGHLPPPYGRTFTHAPSGRITDGRVIIDFMAESLGLPYLSAFLDSIGTNFSHGANFATAGSTIRPQTAVLPLGAFSPFSLDVQHVQYSNLLNRAKIARQQEFHRRLLPENDVSGRALYTFDIGQNDLAAAHLGGMTSDEAKAIIPDILRHFSNVIQKLYGQGGRSFWIHNNGPMGCLTTVISRLPDTETARFDEYGCSISHNELSQNFNLGLKEMVLQLREELPEAAITYVDIYSIKYKLFGQAKKLGFEDPLLVCCGWGEGEQKYDRTIGCSQTKVVNGTMIHAKSCDDPSVRLNWDGVHLSEAANEFIFTQLVDGSFSDPPVPLKFACNRGRKLPKISQKFTRNFSEFARVNEILMNVPIFLPKFPEISNNFRKSQ